MDHIIERFGEKSKIFRDLPYQWQHILSFLDECQSLIDNWEARQAFDSAAAFQTLDMVERMATLCYDYRPPSDHLARWMNRNEERVLRLVANMTIRMRQCIFDLACLPDLAFPGICQHCKRVLRQALGRRMDSETGKFNPEYQEFLIAVDTWPTLSTLETGSKSSGCQVCGLLKESLQTLPIQSDSPYESQITLWFHYVEPNRIYGFRDYDNEELVGVEEDESDDNGWREQVPLLCVAVKGNCTKFSHSDTLAVCTFLLSTTSETLCQQLKLRQPPLPTSLIAASVAFIENTLSNSEVPRLDHTYCPKRLLDMGLSRFSTPRIVEELHARGACGHADFSGLRYAALSYCWGTPEQAQKQLKLTTENRDSFCSGIAEADMTPIIKDAMTVCHALSIRYLWVDALCILQGSGGDSDWEEQSFEMSRIFGNAWITICTPASTSCLDGFLNNVDRQSPEAQFEWSLDDIPSNGSGNLQLRLLTTGGKPDAYVPFDVPQMSPLELDLKHSSWDKRGWIFQERILSPRKVFFGSKMVHTQNNDIISSENGYRAISRFGGSGLYDDSGTCLSRELIQRKGAFASNFWYSIIEPFPRKVFTNKTDILPALSGVARKFSEGTGHTYMAGLWKEDLHCGLLWTTSDHNCRSLDQLIHVLQGPPVIAPSWSWASNPSFREFMITSYSLERCEVRSHLKPEFSLLSSEYVVQGDNPLGRLMQASITIRARILTPHEILRTTSLEYCVWNQSNASAACIRLDWEQEDDMSRRDSRRLLLLLIASCCSNVLAYKAPLCWNCPSGGGLLKCSECGRDYTDCEVIVGFGRRKEDRRKFFADGEPSFNTAVDCSFCADKSLRRDVWGLVIVSTGKSNKYYRVGMFISRAIHGGSDIFRAAEDREIILI